MAQTSGFPDLFFVRVVLGSTGVAAAILKEGNYFETF